MFADQIIAAVLSAVVIIDLAFGAILFYLNKRHEVNQLFSLWMLALATWTLTLIAFFGAADAATAVTWMRAAYASAIIAVVAFWYFATQFPKPVKLPAAAHVANAASLVVFVAAIMATPLIVVGVIGRPWAQNVVISSVGWTVYAVYLLYFFLSAHLILYAKFLRASGVERMQLKYVVLSVFIGGGIFGVFFNLVLPSPIFREWDLIWLGPAATTATIVPFVAYAVTKHNLFNVRGVFTEILVGYTVAFALIDAVFFETVAGFFLKAAVAVAITFFGVVLIRRVNADERRRLELQRITVQLEKANERLKEVDRQRSEFISIASHQLRTPMTVIKGYLSLALEGAYGRVGPTLRDKLELVFSMNDRLVHMIGNMLNMSRIEKGKIEYLCSEFDVRQVAAQVVDEMSTKAKQKGLAARLVGPEARPVIGYGDPDKVREVLVNLMDNAIKYSKKGTVTVRVKRAAGAAVVTVEDRGIGIAPDDARNLFRRFYRGKQEDGGRESGTGLGLYICARFMKDMGGSIGIARTAPGKGTTFEVRVPLKKGSACD
jgi:signal transduction histidine kinase